MDGSIPNICSLLYGTAISRQVAIFGVILPFYTGEKWVKIFTNRSGQAEGGVKKVHTADSLISKDRNR